MLEVIKLPEESKITFIGDCHLNHIAPKSRIDDYPQTSINKLESLRNLMLRKGSNYLIMLGDIFHKPKQPVDFLVKIIKEFQLFWDCGISVFTITGNHDISFDRLDTLEKGALGLLYEVGVIKHLDKIEVGSRFIIDGIDYSQEIPIELDMSKYNILVAHMFYEFDLSEDSIKKEDLEKIGYNMLILGHDHVCYDNEVVKTPSGLVRIVRPGSFMRGTSHSYNVKRKPVCDTLVFDGKLSIERDIIPSLEPKEVFTSSVIDKPDNKQLSQDLAKEFNSLVNQLYNTEDNKISVYDVLDKIDVDSDVRERIIQYLEMKGIFRKSIDSV